MKIEFKVEKHAAHLGEITQFKTVRENFSNGFTFPALDAETLESSAARRRSCLDRTRITEVLSVAQPVRGLNAEAFSVARDGAPHGKPVFFQCALKLSV